MTERNSRTIGVPSSQRRGPVFYFLFCFLFALINFSLPIQPNAETKAEIHSSKTNQKLSINHKQVAKLISDLYSKDFDKRDTAFQKLLRANKSIVEPLKKEIAKSKDADFLWRAKRIVLFHEDGGKTSSGLKVILKLNKKTISLGETIEFTTVLCNTTEKEMILRTGYSLGGIYFETGSVLRCVSNEKNHRDENKQTKPVRSAVFQGPSSSEPIFIHLPAKGMISYKCKAKLINKFLLLADPGKKARNSHSLALGRDHYFAMKADKEGIQRFCISHNVSRFQKPELTKHWTSFQEKKKFAWEGTVHSNEVKLKVIPSEEKAVAKL